VNATTRRAIFFLALSAALVGVSLVLELSWRTHVREAIELGPLTPPRIKAEIATELQLFGIGLKALAVSRILLVLPTAVVWVLWLIGVRRRPAVVGAWATCTLATLALWAHSASQIRTLSGRAAPGLQREAILSILADVADVAVGTDLALITVAAAALILVKAAKPRQIGPVGGT
jgi:hypothetical protein